MLGAVTLPTLLALLLFSVVVNLRVRADRLADLDRSLASKAGGLAALVERDWGSWEMDDPDPGVITSLTAVQVRGSDGTEVYTHGTPGGRSWSGEFTVRDEGSSTGPARVRITLSTSTEPLEAELRSLQSALFGAGLAVAGLAFGVGVFLARRIVSTETLTQRQARYDQQARFTADASHELRTPLAVIRTEVEVALRRDRSTEQYREALVGVREGAARMQGVLESLLLLARADAGGSIDRVPVDLHHLAEEECGGVPVTGIPSIVTGDPRLLAILLRNLVSNAIRHTPDGSVRVDVRPDGDMVFLVVADKGEGIPPEALPRVRERFFRVDTARSRDHGGSGLGLSIVDTVARLHGGTLSLTSTVGVGTTVTVRFPSAGLQVSRSP